jgi:3'-5' exonuclease
MENFSKFLVELSEVVKQAGAGNTEQTVQAQSNMSNLDSPANIEEFGNPEQNDEIIVNRNVALRNQQRRMQQREDDEEEFENRGRQAGGAKPTESGSGGGLGGMFLGAIGAAAVGFGAYAAYKSYTLNKEPQGTLAESTREIQKKLKEMEEDLEEYPVIGMDCQWRVHHDEIRNPVALLQLATHKGKIMLIQLQKVRTLPEELKKLLLNPNIIKAGIEGNKDMRYLREDYQIEVRSSFDIRFLAEDTGNSPQGLKNLAESVLGIDIGRSWDTISSNWDQYPLEPDQIAYAEAAVRCSVEIFTKLFNYMESAPTRQKVLDYCHNNMDKPFTVQKRN